MAPLLKIPRASHVPQSQGPLSLALPSLRQHPLPLPHRAPLLPPWPAGCCPPLAALFLPWGLCTGSCLCLGPLAPLQVSPLACSHTSYQSSLKPLLSRVGPGLRLKSPWRLPSPSWLHPSSGRTHHLPHVACPHVACPRAAVTVGPSHWDIGSRGAGACTHPLQATSPAPRAGAQKTSARGKTDRSAFVIVLHGRQPVTGLLRGDQGPESRRSLPHQPAGRRHGPGPNPADWLPAAAPNVALTPRSAPAS